MSAGEVYPENPQARESAESLQFIHDGVVARPVRVQLENEEEARKHFPEGVRPPIQTAFNHYATRMFLWDTELVAEVMAELGSKEIVDWAAYSLLMLTEKQRPDGFLSNMQYLDHNGGLHLGGKLERWTFNNKEGSDYTQPALLPTAVKAVFEGYLRVGDEESAWQFLREMHPRAKLHIEYFKNHRFSSDDNPSVFNIHPCEDGRDSSGASKFKLPRIGERTPQIWDNADVVQDVVLTYIQNLRLKAAGWDLEKARKIYGRRDVMFNAILSKNSYIMGDLSRLLAQHDPIVAKEYKADADMFDEYADGLEKAIYKHMWFPDAVWSPETRTHKGAFYSLKGNGKREELIDEGDVMTVMLPNLKAEHLVSNLNLILTSFNTESGMPSTPKDSPVYDPHRRRKTGCNWSATWPHMNKLAAKDGLRLQAERIETEPEFREQFESEFVARQTQFLCNLAADILAQIAKKLTREVYAEMYDPETGMPQRYPEVKNFGMAMQADILPYFGLDQRASYYNLCRRLGRVVNIISV